jgi:hypothetical protein
MTEKEEILCNKLIAAGGWLRRAMDKRRVLYLYQADHALREAAAVIQSAIEFVRGPQDGGHVPKL